MLQIEENRKALKYTWQEKAARVAWGVGAKVFRFSPRICFGFRRTLLRLFGAKVGKKVHIYPSAIVYFPWNLSIGDYSSIGEDALVYNLGKCCIGANVTISQRAHLCGGSHDYLDSSLPLLKTPISIDDDSWICTDAFVGPGVYVGRGAVVAACAVVTKNVDEWSVVGGNPAKFIKRREMSKTHGQNSL